MTTATGRLDGAPPARFKETRRLSLPGPLPRAAVLAGDLIGGMALAVCIPFVIVAIGTPIALCLRLLLWAGGWL
jgi:hypothetical protein